MAVWISGHREKLISFRCPWCSENSTSKVYGVVQDITTFYMLARCGNERTCRRGVLIRVESGSSNWEGGVGGSSGEWMQRWDTYPAERRHYAPEHVPPEIAGEFQQALGSFAAGFHIGAVLTARRVLQTAVRQFTSERGTLESEIDKVPDESLPVPTKRVAHGIRLLGNDAAHADPITGEDAEIVLSFTETVLDQLYITPGELAKVAAKYPPKKAEKLKPPT